MLNDWSSYSEGKKTLVSGGVFFGFIFAFWAIVEIVEAITWESGACKCVTMYDKYVEGGAHHSQSDAHHDKYDDAVIRCRNKYDGLNNARRICDD